MRLGGPHGELNNRYQCISCQFDADFNESYWIFLKWTIIEVALSYQDLVRIQIYLASCLFHVTLYEKIILLSDYVFLLYI